MNIMQIPKMINKDDLTKTEIPGIHKVGEGVLINKDNEALTAYKRRKQNFKAVEDMQQELSSLKEDMREIKELLKGLVK